MTLIDEMVMAARGVFALLSNNKNSPKFFDLTYAGLAGATIALLISLSLSAFLPSLIGQQDNQALLPYEAIIFTGTIYIIQIGAAAIIFNQFSRLDALVPYLVADFWSTFFVTTAMLLPSVLNLKNDLIMLILAICVLVIKINILRLIIKLPSAWHIVAFFAAQLGSGFIALIVLGHIFGVDPMINSQPQ